MKIKVDNKEDSIWEKKPPFLVVSDYGSVVLVTRSSPQDSRFSGVALVKGADFKPDVGTFSDNWPKNAFSLSGAVVTMEN